MYRKDSYDIEGYDELTLEALQMQSARKINVAEFRGNLRVEQNLGVGENSGF